MSTVIKAPCRVIFRFVKALRLQIVSRKSTKPMFSKYGEPNEQRKEAVSSVKVNLVLCINLSFSTADSFNKLQKFKRDGIQAVAGGKFLEYAIGYTTGQIHIHNLDSMQKVETEFAAGE
jgi:hypothetical protein